MCNLPLILAATLSLSSTNDYVFTTPATTNLLGVGLGTSAAYAVPRLEDMAFLTEAYVERAHARGFFVSKAFFGDYLEGLPPAGGLGGKGVYDWEDIYPYDVTNAHLIVYSMFPLTVGGWGYACDAVTTLYCPGIFVSPSFTIDATTGLIETGPDWCVDGISTADTNGLAFVTRRTFQDCILPGRTNTSLFGAMTLAHVTNAYYNAGLCGPVLGVRSGDFSGESDPVLVRQVSYGGSTSVTRQAHEIYADYTYPNEMTGKVVTNSMVVGITLDSPVERHDPEYTEDVARWDRWSIECTDEKGKRHMTSYQILRITADGETIATNKYVGDPWIGYSSTGFWFNKPTENPSNRIEATNVCLSTNAVRDLSLVDSVDFIIVAQLRIDMTESLFANSIEDYTTNTTAWAVGWLWDKDAERKNPDADEPFPVYAGKSSTEGLLKLWWQQTERLVPSIEISDGEVPDPASLHSKFGTSYKPGAAGLTRTRKLTIYNLWCYPLIHRRYNAYFED